MDISILKRLFDEGALRSARIVPAPMEPNRFLLVVNTLSGNQEAVTTINEKKTKVYKRETGAISDARTIGFKEVCIRFN